MAITVDTDTYISVADADTYVAANYISTDTTRTSWENLSTANKEIYLKKATKKIDRQYIRGIKAVTTQTLEFPRALYSDYSRDSYPLLNISLDGDWLVETAVSQYVLDAQVEESLGLMLASSNTTASKRASLQQQGVKKFKLGDLEEDYGQGVTSSYNSTRLLSVEAKELLRYYLTGSVGIC